MRTDVASFARGICGDSMVRSGLRALLLASFFGFGLGFGAFPFSGFAQEQEQMSQAQGLAKIRESLARYRAKGMIREMKFIPIPAGKFVMGCNPKTEGNCDGVGTSHHSVTLDAFEIQETEVTQAQWLEVMGSNPSRFKDPSNCPGNYIQELQTCPNHPVEQISWNEIADPDPKNLGTFLKKFNASKLLQRALLLAESYRDGCTYQLPTEAQWEYAARVGTNTQYFCGNDMSCIETHANYARSPLMIQGGLGFEPTDVGSFAPNSWGLYDLSGNVWEWVNDWHGDYPTAGSRHMTRGGSWAYYAQDARSANRRFNYPYPYDDGIGFRLVRICR